MKTAKSVGINDTIADGWAVILFGLFWLKSCQRAALVVLFCWTCEENI